MASTWAKSHVILATTEAKTLVTTQMTSQATPQAKTPVITSSKHKATAWATP